MIKKYFKKPVPVDAIQWTGDNKATCLMFSDRIHYNVHDDNLGIHTLEGTMRPRIGDYIVKGSMDDVWFVKKEIFEVTYEEIK